MFFPFLDYQTQDFTHVNDNPVVAFTTPFRGMHFVEVLYSHANDPQKGISVYTDQINYSDDYARFTLLKTGDYAPNEQNYVFLPAGLIIIMARADQYGSATIRLHSFRLPD